MPIKVRFFFLLVCSNCFPRVEERKSLLDKRDKIKSQLDDLDKKKKAIDAALRKENEAWFKYQAKEAEKKREGILFFSPLVVLTLCGEKKISPTKTARRDCTREKKGRRSQTS